MGPGGGPGQSQVRRGIGTVVGCVSRWGLPVVGLGSSPFQPLFDPFRDRQQVGHAVDPGAGVRRIRPVAGDRLDDPVGTVIRHPCGPTVWSA